MIYLYVKTSPLGLKYLGQTIRDPFKYTGTGHRWLKHLKKHKLSTEDIKTEILFTSYNREEIKAKGLYYSDLWNIVKSDEWANLIKECGNTSAYQGSPPEEVKERIREKLKGRHRPPEVIEKMRKAFKGKVKTKEQLEKMFVVPVVCLDLDGNFIKEYSSIKEASEETLYHYDNIRTNIKGKNHTCGNNIFIRKENYDPSKNYKYTNKNKKIIIQMDLNGNFIKEWEGVYEFLKENSLPRHTSSVGQCCSGKRKRAYGFTWKYKN